MTQPPAGWDRTDDEPDEGQLSTADTLVDRGLDDALDEGYSPPENYRGVTAFGVTGAEATLGESLDQRLTQEVPEEPLPSTGPWAPSIVDYEGIPDEADEFFDPAEVGEDRAGRLVALDGGIGPDYDADLLGEDVGIDGGAASAEEAAMHIVDRP
jgi:hypothetical protein